MAASRFSPTTQLKTESFDMDSFFDFNQGTSQPSPNTASSSKMDTFSPYEKEERQHFNGPSHDYGQFKQQVGLPAGSMASLPQMSNSNGMYDGFNSGISDMDFGWNSGIDYDADMSMDISQPAMFFPPPVDGPSDTFVNPNNVDGHEEPVSNVGRLWPGMHSQQAQQLAMQKAAQAQAVQQRQMKLQAQQAQYRQAVSASQSQSSLGSSQHDQGNGKRASHTAEPHVEESISRLLNQMRQNSSAGDAESPSDDILPHIARMKKDEEDMDEDERLLASEEGKKLSSKERRQLRNKVSARAFRSRRKEYIGQLEGEVAVKAQESALLRQQNQELIQENERYRGLIETLLRHEAFTPFIKDISENPASLPMLPKPQPQQQQQQQSSVTPTPQPPQPQQQMQPPPQQDMKPDFMNFDASQLQVPSQQQPEQQTVGLSMIPENDFSKLNINSFNSMNFNNYSVNAYAVTAVPCGPDPVELLSDSPARLPRSVSAISSAASSSASDSGLSVLLAKLDKAASRTAPDESVS